MSASTLWNRVIGGRSRHGRTSSTASAQNPTKNQTVEPPQIPKNQKVLLLRDIKQPYEVEDEYPVPEPDDDASFLVKTQVIGLNPIDWKAPDFNFGIPELPYISGRELVGEVVQLPRANGRLKLGEKVIVISTNYRDLRKAAYQQYVLAVDFNVVRLPRSLSAEAGATIGVAFVAAVLGLGICMGVDFSGVQNGPDLLQLVRKPRGGNPLPEDIRTECLEGISSDERAKDGDWIAVWGGSSTSANLTIQLARLAGLRVITIVDKAKHGLRLSNHKMLRPDLLVDSHDPERAIDIIRAATRGKLRFALDTRGKDSASALLQALGPVERKVGSTATSLPSPPRTPPYQAQDSKLAHLVGLTGLPKGDPPKGVKLHSVPIKLFHEVPEAGRALVEWLEKLLEKGLIEPPDVIAVDEGLENINLGLDRMRRGEISGGKAVVRLV